MTTELEKQGEEQCQSPTEKLAEGIEKRLEEQKVLSKEQLDKVMTKLRAGRLTTSDWRMAIDLSLPKTKAE